MLNRKAGVLTQPGAPGNDTISLPPSFDPKWIKMWTSGLPGPAGVGVHGVMGWGIGTYRGGVVQQGFQCHFHTDGAATMDLNHEIGSDALLVLRPDGATGARDLEIDLVSMASSSVVVNWVNLHTTPNIQVNYLIMGGSDITDALALNFSNLAGLLPVDVTVAAGFKPDVVFLSHAGADAAGLGQDSKIQLGWAKSDTEQRYFSAQNIEASTTSMVKMAQGDTMIEGNEGVDVTSYVGELEVAARASWPSDGFRINHPSDNSFLDYVIGLAIKGTFTVTVGSATSPTVPGDQDLAIGDGIPKAIMILGGNLPPTVGLDITHPDLFAWGIGASDMVTEVYAGMSDDDGLGTSDCNRSWTDQKVWQIRGPSNALLGECDCSVVGAFVRLTWTTVDTTAREFNYVIFGEVPVLPVFEDPNITAWADPQAPISPLAT